MRLLTSNAHHQGRSGAIETSGGDIVVKVPFDGRTRSMRFDRQEAAYLARKVIELNDYLATSRCSFNLMLKPEQRWKRSGQHFDG